MKIRNFAKILIYVMLSLNGAQTTIAIVDHPIYNPIYDN